jgi:energy-converting hydrogenase A subunit A
MIIHANVLITISSYILAVASAMIVGLVLRIPILPERPMRQSWTISLIFPTSIITLGLTAILFKLGYEGLLIGIVAGVVSAIFAKYFLEKLLPKLKIEESS